MVHTDWRIFFPSLSFVVKGQFFFLLKKKGGKREWKEKSKRRGRNKFFCQLFYFSVFTKQKFYSYSHSPVAFLGQILTYVLIKRIKEGLGHIQRKNKELLWRHRKIQKRNILNIFSH